MNSGTLWLMLGTAEARVLDHQRKLHCWARSEPARRFDDVFNLVCDRATLTVAWERVVSNRGARTAGVDGMTRLAVNADEVVPLLEDLRSSLKDGSFVPLPVRETTIPKKGGKRRTLGIPWLSSRDLETLAVRESSELAGLVVVGRAAEGERGPARRGPRVLGPSVVLARTVGGPGLTGSRRGRQQQTQVGKSDWRSSYYQRRLGASWRWPSGSG